MNRRQKKKKNTKYEYAWGNSYHEIRVFDRKIHEINIKTVKHFRYLEKKEGIK